LIRNPWVEGDGAGPQAAGVEALRHPAGTEAVWPRHQPADLVERDLGRQVDVDQQPVDPRRQLSQRSAPTFLAM
jgi:hypothetical protein